MLISLCVAMWRLPTVIETFAGTLGQGGTTDASVRAALNAATGRAPSAETDGPSGQDRVFAAGGRDLTDEERRRLLNQARAAAPLKPDGPSPTAAGKAGEDTSDRVRRELERILSERKPPR